MDTQEYYVYALVNILEYQRFLKEVEILMT